MRRHGRGAGAGFLVGFGIFILILGAYATSEEWKYNGFDSMEPTAIASVEMGKLVKVVGRVDSSPFGGPVIEKVTTISGKHTRTSYEHVDHFTVSDSTGFIVVTMNTESVVRYRGDEYHIGDDIVIVGVVKDYDGEKSISVQGVAKEPDGFGEKGALRYFGEGVLAIGLLMTISGTVVIIRNRRKGGPETGNGIPPVPQQPGFSVPGVVDERYGRLGP